MIVIQNAINPSLLRAVWATWPERKWRGWHHYSGKDSEKYGTKSHHDIPPAVMACIMEMISRVRSEVLPHCFPDLELHGAGMHMIPPGGYLRPHLDSAVMESTGWRREYSCVLNVNPVWVPSWGGTFVHQGRESSPEFNQLALFRTTEESIHEVTDVIGPNPRCTLAVFFWSQDPPADVSRTSARFF